MASPLSTPRRSRPLSDPSGDEPQQKRRLSDPSGDEPQQKRRRQHFQPGPLAKIMDVPVMPLVDASEQIEELPNLVVAARKSLEKGKLLAKNDSYGLNCDESGALHMYTDNENEFAYLMNKLCRESDSTNLERFLPLASLMIRGYWKLPKSAGIGWRGLKGVNLMDVYTVGETVRWWSWTSVSKNMRTAVEYFGKTGLRTFFMIEFKSAANIIRYSAHSDEEEVLLAPGVSVRVQTSAMLTEDLCLIHLVEVVEMTLEDVSSQPV